MTLGKWQVVLLKNGIFGPVVTIDERSTFMELLPLNENQLDEYPFTEADIVTVLLPGEWETMLDPRPTLPTPSVQSVELDPLVIFEVVL
jgi:hypothetical protein